MVIHVEGALQLPAHTLVEGDLLSQVGLHHLLEVHHPSLVEVVHLCLKGKAHGLAALPHAVRLVPGHLPLLTHLLAFLHLAECTWTQSARACVGDTH